MQVALLMLASALIVASAIGVLVWALGWGVLVVLGAGVAVFVIGSVVRDFIQDNLVSRR